MIDIIIGVFLGSLFSKLAWYYLESDIKNYESDKE